MALALSANVAVAQNCTGGDITTTCTVNTNRTGNIFNSTTSTITVTVTGQSTTLTGNIGSSLNSNGSAGATNVNFNNGSQLKGNILTGRANNGNDFSKKVVTFNGSSPNATVMTGNIESYGTGFAINPTTGNGQNEYNGYKAIRGNHITFQKGSMRGDIKVYGIHTKAFRYGYNSVKFTDTSGTQTLHGNIINIGAGNDYATGRFQTNDVTFNYGGTITGNVETRSGANNITFGTNNGNDNKQGTINGRIYAGTSNGSGAKSINTITFYGNGQTASIVADGGKNNITFNKGLSSTITGPIEAFGSGINTISFQGNNNNNATIKGNITSKGGGQTKITTDATLALTNNTITAEWQSVNTITAGQLNATNLTLSSVYRYGLPNNDKITENKISANNGNIEIASLTVSDGWFHKSKYKNTLTLQTPNKLTINNFENDGGTNQVTVEGIASGEILLGHFRSNAGDNIVQASTSSVKFQDNARLFVGGGGAGKNSITAKNITSQGLILEAGGAGGPSLNELTTQSGEMNLASSTANQGGENKITFNLSGSAENASLTIQNLRTSAGGKNTINFASGNNGTQTITITNIANDSGTNTITGGNATVSLDNATISSAGRYGVAGENTITSKTVNANGLTLISEGYRTIKNTNSITAETGNISNLVMRTSIRGENTLTLRNNATITIKEITSASGNNTITATEGTSTVTFDNARVSTGTTYEGNGVNTITAKTINSNGLILEANGFGSYERKNSITATNGTLDITTISSTGGTNEITLKNGSNATLTIGNIANNAGKVAVTTNNQTNIITVSGDISTYGGGTAQTNLLAETAKLTLKAKSIKTDGNSNSNNTTSIVAKAGGTITLDNGIQTLSANSKTNLYLAGSDSTSKLTGNITNSGKTNIILNNAIWAPNSIQSAFAEEGTPASGTLTNKGGETNLVMRKTASGRVVSGTSATYSFDLSGGKANIVMQDSGSNGNVVNNINYGGGSATFIFASSSDTAQDSLENNLANNKVLGKTYKDGVKLDLSDITISLKDQQVSLINTFGSRFHTENEPLLKIDVSRTTNKDTITVNGLAAGKISSLASTSTGTSNAKAYDVTLESNSAFVGSLGIEAKSIALTMKNGSKLVFAGNKDTAHTKIATLKFEGTTFDSTQILKPIFDQSNTIINLATGVNDVFNAPNRKDFRLLEIGTKGNRTANTGLVGNSNSVLFQVYVNNKAGAGATLGNTAGNNKVYGEQYNSDRIVVHNVGDNTTANSQALQIVYDASTKLEDIKYTDTRGTEWTGNIAVATVKNTNNSQAGTSGAKSDSGVLKFQLQNTLQGFDEVASSLVGVYTDEYGKVSTSSGQGNTHTTYFIDNARSLGASQANREATATALASNYDLYFANFNSLNKRMGELRNNPHSQGAWMRIFNGSQTNDMGLGSKSTYTTFQGGYDYDIGMEGANNYIGLALSYSMSSSKTQADAKDLNGTIKGVDNIKSSAVEVALYNAYVQDEGWYNDSILKFSYIMSDFNMLGQSSNYSTSNMAFTLSDEFGYRFKLGENKEWYIDPQLEVSFGYFDQSDFVQKLGVSSLQATANSIITLRNRFGASFGYDFKNFTESKPIKASVYVGTFYEYDFISGGDITMITNLGSKNSINTLSSDGRVVMNVGTNLEVYDNTRIYFDFESSFAGKIRTDYQVNVGARYSFGENAGYKPMQVSKKEATPLKIDNANEQKEEKAPSKK